MADKRSVEQRWQIPMGRDNLEGIDENPVASTVCQSQSRFCGARFCKTAPSSLLESAIRHAARSPNLIVEDAQTRRLVAAA